jgi:Na+/melibiose symporter-like transporter
MELTSDYDERTRLFAVRQIFYVLGTIAGMLIPVYLAKKFVSRLKGYSMFALFSGGMVVLILGIAFWRIKERTDIQHTESYPFFEGLKVTFKNKALLSRRPR